MCIHVLVDTILILSVPFAALDIRHGFRRHDICSKPITSPPVETIGMVPILVRDISTIAIGKMLLLVQGVGQQWSIPDDNIMELIRQVVPKDIPEPAFLRH
ncbi:unnamed protein product [Lactuca saligna]|uniref:Uncharacterized protein n=1 Tax=Lactuca saligna TaxID=75948 RepID=A0AA35V3Q2_LACSI|nr:unnamed protein product [Lactuca saligna]